MLELLPFRGESLSPFFREDDCVDLFGSLFSDFSHMFDVDDGFYTNDFCTNDEGDSIIEIEVPGFNKDNLKVEVSDGILTVKGERDLKNIRCAGQTKVYKRIKVGDAENVEAKLKDGVLTITVKHPKEEVRKIEVK